MLSSELPDWDCANATEQERLYRGCDRFEGDGKDSEEIDTKWFGKVGSAQVVLPYCPHTWIAETSEALEIIYSDVARFLRHGVLPAAGGLLDQDCQFVEALDIVSAEVTRLQKG